MDDLELVTLNAGERDEETNAPVAGAYVQIDETEQKPLGTVPLMQCLGITSMPMPADSKGKAEGICAAVAGMSAVCIAAWDTRSNAITGNMKPGDTVVHTTGPNPIAQLMLKNESKTVALVTRGSDGKQMILALDGKNDSFLVSAFGHLISITDEGVTLSSKNGANSINVGDDLIHIKGAVMLGGMVPLPDMGLVQMNKAAITVLSGLVAAGGGMLLPVMGVGTGV